MNNRSGQILGTYHLLHLLGQGGFADVYLGQHIHLHTLAAIKVLSSTRLHNTTEIDGFKREAQIVASLVHPHIIRILDFAISNEIPFFVMEYAAQGSLRQRHPRGTRLPLDTILIYVRQAAQALQYAHGHKQIHQDVKPENLLLREDGSLILSDFGMATLAHSSRSQRTEEIIGTIAYMAPEQMQGHPQEASDQYALAIVIYEWLTGKPPFAGTAVEIAMQHTTAQPPPLLQQVPDLPPALEEVLFKALNKDPKQRFASIQEFALALEQAKHNKYNAALFPQMEVKQARQNERVTIILTPQETPLPAITIPEASTIGASTIQTSLFAQSEPMHRSDSSDEQRVKRLAGYDWETVVSKIGLKDTPTDWQLYYSYKQVISNVLIAMRVSIILGLAFLLSALWLSRTLLAIPGVAIFLLALLSCIIIWREKREICLLLLPGGLLLGNLRKKKLHLVIDYNQVENIRSVSKKIVIHQRTQGKMQDKQIQEINLDHFEDPQELAQRIEGSFLQWKLEK